MRKLLKSIIFAFLAIPAMAQIPAPQINLGGNIGCQGFPCLNSGTLQFTSDANHTMTAQESSATGGIKVTSTVTLTATRNLVLPSGNLQFIAVENATTGGQSIQVIGTSGTGVTIANGSSATVWFDGTNVVQTGSSGGSSGFPITLGSTSIASSSTTTAVAGLTVDGVSPTTMGFVDPTSSIQTQLNAKATTANNGPIEGFGTSVTQGVGSWINGDSYIDILATDSANGMQNWGVGGDQAADMVHQVFRKFPQNSNFRPALTILDPFINDANHCGNTAGCLANAAEALNASIAWTAIPASYRTYATAATNSGFTNAYTPFTDQTLPEIGMSTTTQNATLTFSLTNAGTKVGVTFGACDAYTAATFTVTLGGTLVDTVSPIGNSGQTILTQNGASCTLFRKEYANSSGATVSLVIQKTDATTSAAGTVSIWAVDTNPTGSGTGAPVVFTEGTIKQNADANSAATAAFDTQANTTATAFATDGWNSFYVPLRAGQSGANPGVNSSTDMTNSPPVNPNENVGLHPNSGPGGGHFHLAQTIENFATANGFKFFNVGVSGGHQFFFTPIQQFQHYAPSSMLGYNNFGADSTLSQTALNPGGILVNGYVSPTGAVTASGMDLGYDPTIAAYIGRSFSTTGYYEICPTGGLITLQSQFNCGHDIFWSNGDYVKPFGFFRPKGGISYEGQVSSAAGKTQATNTDRGNNVNFVSTAAGSLPWMLPLCKSNTYDYQMYYYKSTGDTNPVVFNAYNTADSINGNTSTVTGTITGYSIVSNALTILTTTPPAVNSAVTLSGFGTSTFLNGISSTVLSVVAGTSYVVPFTHINASATEAGSFAINASWTGMTAPYSGAVVQCSIGPTGISTISIAQFGDGTSGAIPPSLSGSFTPNDLTSTNSSKQIIDSGIAASNVPLLNANNQFSNSFNGFESISLLFPIIAGTNGNSPVLDLTGQFYNGSVTGYDVWGIEDVVGSGTSPTSTLMFSHTGSPGPIAVSMPALQITGPGMPIATGTTSNTDLAGQITLSTGSGSYTFTSTHATSPIVVCTDTTALLPVQCSASTTAITITGTASDVINYIVVGRT